MLRCFSCVQVFVTAGTIAHQPPLSMGLFPGRNTGMGCPSILQRIFPTQGINPWLLNLLHFRGILFFSFLFFFFMRDSLPLSHYMISFSSVQSLSHDRLFVTPWIAACQASQSITNSWSSLRLTSIESVMPSSHLILCRPLLLLPPIPPSIRVFSNESSLRMKWPKYWSFSFSIIPSKEIPGLISFRMN